MKIDLIKKFYKNKNILVIGHTGFKGSWLSICLKDLGAKVFGISKDIPTKPSHYQLLDFKKQIKDYRFDIRDYKKLKKTILSIKPDIIFHLAAQSLVKESFRDPYKTWTTNLMGSINISQVFCEYFVKNKIAGNIINVASIYSIVAPNLALYNKKLSSINQKNKPMDYVISKSSIPNLTRFIATNYGRQKIRSNCIVPHGIKNVHKKEFIKRYSDLSPMGRMSDVSEVIGPIVFLSTKASSYMTGATLIIDGGWTAW